MSAHPVNTDLSTDIVNLFGPRGAELFDIPCSELADAIALLLRDEERLQGTRDEWGNWDG